MEELQQQILNIVSTTVLPLLVTAAGSLAVLGLNHFNNWLKSKVHQASFACATDKLTSLVSAAVEEAQHTTVEALKAKDGGWNEETAKTVRDGVAGVVKRHLGTKGMKELVGCLGVDENIIEGRIHTLIESYLLQRKEGNSSASNAPPHRQEGPAFSKPPPSK